jgi:hypothetical protein
MRRWWCQNRSGLSRALALTSRRWAAQIAGEEAERLTPIVLTLSERCARTLEKIVKK